MSMTSGWVEAEFEAIFREHYERIARVIRRVLQSDSEPQSLVIVPVERVSEWIRLGRAAESQQAVDFAKHLSQRVVLLDGENLMELMIEHDIGVRVNRAIQFKRIDEDFFSEED